MRSFVPTKKPQVLLDYTGFNKETILNVAHFVASKVCESFNVNIHIVVTVMYRLTSSRLTRLIFWMILLNHIPALAVLYGAHVDCNRILTSDSSDYLSSYLIIVFTPVQSTYLWLNLFYESPMTSPDVPPYK